MTDRDFNTTPVGLWLDCLNLPEYKEQFFQKEIYTLQDVVDLYTSRYVY